MADSLIFASLILEYVDHTSPASHVDAMTLRIDKHVIRVTACIEVRDDGAVVCGQHQQARRATKGHQYTMSLVVERHREIRAMALCGQRSDLFTLT